MSGQERAVTRLEEYLRSARDRAFVGRTAELGAFRSALTGEPVFTVLFLHGAGGTGKTTLLRRFAVEAERAGRLVARADRFEPGGLIPALLAAVPPVAPGPAGPVVLIDEFDQWQPAESWLREEFLPGLPVGTVVVLASRTPPGLEWTTDPGWNEVLRVHEVGDLSPAEAEMLLDRYAVPRRRQPFLLELAGGNPLALRLAMEAAGEDDEVRLSVAQAVVRQVIGELPSAAHRQALEVCAYAEPTTEAILRATVADADAVELFRWLCELPYVECGANGVQVRPFVRTAVRTELRWRDPQRHEAAQARLAEDAPVVETLPRPEFDVAVRDALRSWRRPDLLADNPLAHSRMVAAAETAAEPVEALRGVLQSTLDALGEDPRQGKPHRALIATYLGGAPTQEAAAERLGLPFSTYRRHLNRGLEVLCSLLWRRESTGLDLI
ncbi:AAA family ATPase [Actinoplanes sp. NPDC051859]|uniref:AAA family ATPase n=1 Tax=Actinoplanes sp. NPDC051859 TaxID=3363909 RepID=UPI0037997B12